MATLALGIWTMLKLLACFVVEFSQFVYIIVRVTYQVDWSSRPADGMVDVVATKSQAESTTTDAGNTVVHVLLAFGGY